MKRSDVVIFSSLLGILLAVGGFVGVQAWRAPRRPKAVAAQSAGASATADAAGNNLSSVRKSSLLPPGPRDYTEISRLLTEANGATYMDAILAARDRARELGDEFGGAA